MAHEGWVILAAALMLPGLAGVVLPVVPGITFMFAVALVFGITDGFRHLSVMELLILLVLVLLSVAVDYLSGILGARYGGATKWAVVAGFVGFMAGLIVFPPFGGIIGMFLAVLIVEASQHRDRKRAFRAASGSVIGTLAGILISLVLALVFIAAFVFFAWR